MRIPEGTSLGSTIGNQEGAGNVNARERFLAVTRFEQPDYVPLLSCSSIDGPNMYTVGTWHRTQGFPTWVDSNSRWDVFWGMTRLTLWAPAGPGEPMPKPEVLARDEVYETLRYADGRVIRQRIGQTATNFYGMPQFIEFPCKTREDWETYRDRWIPTGDGVYPDNWDELVGGWEHRDFPLGVPIPSSVSALRSLFGTQRACSLFYTDPDLVREILRHCRERWMCMVRKLVSDVSLDFAGAGEDFCYRNGCLVSPALFREFIVPHYRELTRFLRGHGIQFVFVDSDGFVEGVIGLLEKAGVNGLEAFEVRAGNDILRVREAHPSFVIRGGLDKFAMDSPDPARAIREVEEKVPALLDEGGYFPGIDHGLPPTSHWRTYLRFMERLHSLCRNPEGSFNQLFV